MIVDTSHKSILGNTLIITSVWSILRFGLRSGPRLTGEIIYKIWGWLSWGRKNHIIIIVSSKENSKNTTIAEIKKKRRKSVL